MIDSICGNRPVLSIRSPDRPGPKFHGEPVVGSGDLERAFAGDFFRAKHFVGRNQQIFGPGEIEAALLQDMPAIGRVDVARLASQLQATEGVSRGVLGRHMERRPPTPTKSSLP